MNNFSFYFSCQILRLLNFKQIYKIALIFQHIKKLNKNCSQICSQRIRVPRISFFIFIYKTSFFNQLLRNPLYSKSSQLNLRLKSFVIFPIYFYDTKNSLLLSFIAIIIAANLFWNEQNLYLCHMNLYPVSVEISYLTILEYAIKYIAVSLRFLVQKSKRWITPRVHHHSFKVATRRWY